MKIVIGCPVQARSWILPAWFQHVETAVDFADVEPIYCFVGSTQQDLETLNNQVEKYGRSGTFEWITEPERDDIRRWSTERLHHMVFLRNRLLQAVRVIAPDYFLSLDSDILLHQESLYNMIETAHTYDAVGGKAYMNAGTGAPSYAMLSRNGNMRRSDPAPGAVMPVDVIMAVKLMSPDAYNVDYVYHRQGEDIGWSLNVKASGLKIGFDGRTTNKHVMRKEHLLKFDKRCGF